MEGEAEIVIDCPVDRAFSFMDDVSREHEWQPNIVEARQDPPGPTAVGTRKMYVSQFMGRRIENTYVVQSIEPNERIVYQTTPESALNAAVEVTWTSVSGGTRVTMRMHGEVSGALKLIPARLMKRAQRRELEASLQSLKAILEGAG